MSMTESLYSKLLEYGCGYRHELDDSGSITSRRPGSKKFITISNSKGQIAVDTSGGHSRIIPNDQHAIETIVGILDVLDDG
jgi:hypothetical protein